MPPVLTPDEIAQMTKESAKAVAAAETFTNQIAAQQARALELAKVDSAFKKFFDYYNGEIIVPYDTERRLINGDYIAAPIIEADILSCANLQGGRIQPALPATDVIRIPQFDGTPIVVDNSNELAFIATQADAEDVLVNGYGGTAPAMTVLTDTSLSASSTTLKLKDLTTTFSIAPNTVLIVSNGGDFAVIKVLTFALEVSPVPPPYVADLTIEVLVAPSGTIPAGQSLDSFSGFTNGERATKTASDPDLQPLMDYLVLQLQTAINSRIANLTSQLIPIAANQDPDGVAELTQATTDVNASKSFLTNYLISTNISDFGLGQLSSERSTRTTQANTRISQITAAYTGRTENYYDKRYSFANNRANTARGSLRLQKNSEAGAATSAGYASTLTDQASAMGSILP
jgi:hypothetical protein